MLETVLYIDQERESKVISLADIWMENFEQKTRQGHVFYLVLQLVIFIRHFN
jgi:hypothetical protein